MHDATAIRDEGVAVCFRHFPDMEVLLDDDCLGLGRDHPGQAITPSRRADGISPPEVHEARLRARHQHASRRVSAEHALADRKRWKQPTRWTRRCEPLADTRRAIAGLVSDLTADA